jgi:hypothetical protein
LKALNEVESTALYNACPKHTMEQPQYPAFDIAGGSPMLSPMLRLGSSPCLDFEPAKASASHFASLKLDSEGLKPRASTKGM